MDITQEIKSLILFLMYILEYLYLSIAIKCFRFYFSVNKGYSLTWFECFLPRKHQTRILTSVVGCEFVIKLDRYTFSDIMIDIDECTPGASHCDGNANCTNYVGSFACVCHSGFVGNGLEGNCTGTCIYNQKMGINETQYYVFCR